MRWIGRMCQYVSMVLLPYCMYLQLLGQIDLRQMLLAMIFGFALFYLGRLLEGYAR